MHRKNQQAADLQRQMSETMLELNRLRRLQAMMADESDHEPMAEPSMSDGEIYMGGSDGSDDPSDMGKNNNKEPAKKRLRAA